MHPFVECFMHPFVECFMHPFVECFMHPFVECFMHPFVECFMHPFVECFMHPFVECFMHPFVECFMFVIFVYNMLKKPQYSVHIVFVSIAKIEIGKRIKIGVMPVWYLWRKVTERMSFVFYFLLRFFNVFNYIASDPASDTDRLL